MGGYGLRGRTTVEIVVREMGKEHLDDVVSLWRLMMEHVESHDPYFRMKLGSDDKFRSYIISHAGKEESVVYVAQGEGKVVGFINGYIKENPPVIEPSHVGFIDCLVVLPEYRRKGIGSRLMSEITAWFEKGGLESVELFHNISNQEGEAFWPALGFALLISRCTG